MCLVGLLEAMEFYFSEVIQTMELSSFGLPKINRLPKLRLQSNLGGLESL